MRKMWLMLAMAAAASAAAKAEPDLVVFVHTGNLDFSAAVLAEGEARRILADAGIAVDWRAGAPKYRGPAKVIEVFVRRAVPSDFRAGSLGFTRLDSEAVAHVEVFYDRIHSCAPPSAVAPILAHVLVHEITHVLEGVARHSASGMMKAHWDAEDFKRMPHASLEFTAEDLGMIHAWALQHRATLLAGVR